MPAGARASSRGTEVDSGMPSPTPWAYYDPESSSLRTWQRSLGDDQGSTLSSRALPASGSMQAGLVYERRMSVHPTVGTGGSALLPTPDAYEGTRGGAQHPDKRKAAGHSPYLACVAEYVLLPTPKARDGKGRDPNPKGVDLNEAVALLPTPRATDGTKGGPNQRGSSGDLMLPSAVQGLLPTPRATRGGSATETVALLPTPTAQDAAGARNSTVVRPPGSTANIGDTLTDAMTVLVGGRTRAPSSAGREPSDGPLPLQLSLDGTDNPG